MGSFLGKNIVKLTHVLGVNKDNLKRNTSGRRELHAVAIE